MSWRSAKFGEHPCVATRLDQGTCMDNRILLAFLRCWDGNNKSSMCKTQYVGLNAKLSGGNGRYLICIWHILFTWSDPKECDIHTEQGFFYYSGLHASY